MPQWKPCKNWLQIGVCLLLVINITTLGAGSRAVDMNEKAPSEMDSAPQRLEGTIIDYYGGRAVVRGPVGALALQNNTAPTPPLANNETLLLSLEEVAIMSPASGGWMLDDHLHSPAFNPIQDLGTSMNQVDGIATGQFDTDPEEEVIAVGFAGNEGIVVIYDEFTQPNTTEAIKARYNFTTPYCVGDCKTHARESAIAVGNFDGIGTDEFAVVFTEWDWDDLCATCPPDNFDSYVDMYIVDPASGTEPFYTRVLELVDQPEIADGGMSDHIALPKLKAGELDGDGRDEIVLTTTGPFAYRGWIYEYTAEGSYTKDYAWEDSGPIETPTWYGWDRASVRMYRDKVLGAHGENNIFTLGDVDGDRRDEIIYMVHTPNGAAIRVMDDRIGGHRDLPETPIYLKDKARLNDTLIITDTGQEVRIHDTSFFTGVMGAGDLDGDGFDEIVVMSLLTKPMWDLRLGDYMWELFDKYDYKKTYGLVFDDQANGYTLLKTWEPAELGELVGKEMALGDIDADGRDEILISTGNNAPTSVDLRVQLAPGMRAGLETIFTGVGTGTHVLDDALHNYTLFYSDFDRKGFITTGDFDADGVKVRYTGDHWTTKAPPKVIMTIAAPPTYRGISQNYVGSYTAVGQETSRGEAEGNSMAFSEGTHWSVGMEIDISVFQVLAFELSVKKSRAISREMARSQTKTQTVSVMRGFQAGAGDDVVVYQLTTFDNYKYEITSHPTTPELIGEFLTIDVPQTSVPWKVTRPYFNAKFSSVAPPIGSETFTHEVGKPWTYPTSSRLDAITPTRWWNVSDVQTVGQGDSAQVTQIEIEHQIASGMTRTYTTESSYDVAGTLIFATAGGGWHSAKVDSQSIEVTIGKAMIYEGSVGDIQDNETWEDLKFSFGLFVYNLERPEGITYQVVNYYVNGASVHEELLYEVLDTLSNVVDYARWFPQRSLAIGGGILLIITYLLLRRRGRKKRSRRRK